MGIMVYSLLWVMQDFVHQPYFQAFSLLACLLLSCGGTQTPGRIHKVDPLMGVPIKYP